MIMAFSTRGSLSRGRDSSSSSSSSLLSSRGFRSLMMMTLIVCTSTSFCQAGPSRDEIFPFSVRGGTIFSDQNSANPRNTTTAAVSNAGESVQRASQSLRRRSPSFVGEEIIDGLKRRNAPPLPAQHYTDVLQCRSPQWMWSGDSDEGETAPFDESDDEDNDFLFQNHHDVGQDDAVDFDTSPFYRNQDKHSDSDSVNKGRDGGDGPSSLTRLLHSPVVYQYYGRSRVRRNAADSINFILLGPNIDHWKEVGQILASRGYNAMACERVEADSTEGQDGDALSFQEEQSKRKRPSRSQDAPNLILEIMEALQWQKVIIVGCDNEATLAIESAMMLASPFQETVKVVGLVLCGDLAEVSNRLVFSSEEERKRTGDDLDSFLSEVLACPSVIVWDGESPSIVSGSSMHTALESHWNKRHNSASDSSRCLILGGGSAPHRTKPEQFAWILTRFVEEKISSFGSATREKKGRGGAQFQDSLPSPLREENREDQVETHMNNGNALGRLLRSLNLPFSINTLVSTEGRLLLGRAVAASLFYITMMRVFIIQYGILRAGLIGVKSRYDTVDALRRKIFQAVTAFFVNYGYIPRLFSVKQAKEEDDEDRILAGDSPTPDLSMDEEGRNEKHHSQSKQGNPNERESVITSEKEKDEIHGNDNTEESGDGKADDEDAARDEQRRSRFRPLFFLDNVVT